MSKSFIFPYRNRLDHLLITLPRIVEVMRHQQEDFELIVVEQKNNKPFRRANLLNEGARVATGDIVVMHDIDYYPAFLDQQYAQDDASVFLPVRRVEFVNNDLTPRESSEIPAGYRHFSISVDNDFFGGVTSFHKEVFKKINGFASGFVGWGFEDADLRERVKHYGFDWKRSDDNLFLALAHPDSGPSGNDMNFQANMIRAHRWSEYLSEGLTSVATSVEECPPAINTVIPNLRWLRVEEFETPFVHPSPISFSTFNYDEGEE